MQQNMTIGSFLGIPQGLKGIKNHFSKGKNKYNDQPFCVARKKIQRESLFRNLGHLPYASLFSLLFVATNLHGFNGVLDQFGNAGYGTENPHAVSVVGILSYPAGYLGTWLGGKITNNALTRKVFIGYAFQGTYRLPAIILMALSGYLFLAHKYIKSHEFDTCVKCQQNTDAVVLDTLAKKVDNLKVE